MEPTGLFRRSFIVSTLFVLSFHLVLFASPLMAQEEGGEEPPVEKSKVDLSLHLKAGDELGYRTNTIRTTRVEGADPAETRLERGLWDKWTVETAEDGRYRIRVETTRVSEKVMGEETVEFDSAGMDAEALARVSEETPQVAPLAGLIGKSYTMTVTAGGKVENVEGLEDYFSSIRESLEGAEDPGSREVARILGEQAKPENFKENLSPLFSFLKGQEVEVGSEWEVARTHAVPGAGLLREEAKYTLGSPDAQGLVEATYDSVVSFEESADREKVFQDMAFELTGAQGTGSVVLDVVSGWIQSSFNRLNWTVVVSLQADPVLRSEQAVEQTTQVNLEDYKRKIESDGGE